MKLIPPIGKIASAPHLGREIKGFATARAAFRSVLDVAAKMRPGTVLLPSYIGWSSNEGSGVFDPVRELGLPYAFYDLSDRLAIDLVSLERELVRRPCSLVLIIHYFGRRDPAVDEAAALARRHGAIIVEDSAHALFADYLESGVGRIGDASIWSLHKLLPVSGGGALVVSDAAPAALRAIEGPEPERSEVLLRYDLSDIARRRRANAAALHRALRGLHPLIEPLWSTHDPSWIAQTYPILVPPAVRDGLYHVLNAAGVGAVSLYHTMITELAASASPAVTRTSRRILNLPVHQDASPDAMLAAVDILTACLGDQVDLTA